MYQGVIFARFLPYNSVLRESDIIETSRRKEENRIPPQAAPVPKFPFHHTFSRQFRISSFRFTSPRKKWLLTRLHSAAQLALDMSKPFRPKSTCLELSNMTGIQRNATRKRYSDFWR